MYPARKIISHTFRGVLLMAGLLTGAGCHASTVISELFYDAAGADNGLVFVELFGTPGTHLDGMLLEGVKWWRWCGLPKDKPVRRDTGRRDFCYCR